LTQRSLDLSTYAPQFEILVNKQLQEDVVNSSISVQITEQTSSPAEFNLVLSDMFNPINQEFNWLGNPLFAIGNKVQINMGYANNELIKIIDGPIKSLSTTGFSEDIPTFTVIGFDDSHSRLTEKSMAEKAIKPDKKDTYSKIVEKIAAAVKLTPMVDVTKEYSAVITKKPVSYHDFLTDAANRTGYEFFVSRGSLYFIDPRKKRSPNMTFEWEKDLIQFIPTINASDIVTGVEIRGHLPDSKTKAVGIANAGDETKLNEKEITASQLALRLNKENIRTIENRTFSSKEEADDMAKAELNRINDNIVTGSATIVGNPKLAPGMIIEFKKVGKLFNGLYFVTGVTNTIGGGGYTTSFSVRKNSIEDV
jgi:Bacteriophage probable baseplate hub protein